MMLPIDDDKGKYVIPFILDLFHEHQKQHATADFPPPLFIGLNGVQGVGKSVLVDILRSTLSGPSYNLATIVFSLDDIYLPHAELLALARANPTNPLLQHRGQPSTHDIPLALKVFHSPKANQTTRIPQFNKALFSGQGDRVQESDWEVVNTNGTEPIRIVTFEGWSVGFQALKKEELEAKHLAATLEAKHASSERPYNGQLGHNTLANITTINEALKKYEELYVQLDGFIHIDVEDLQFVYQWRLEQEAGLRLLRGSGMMNDEVKHFVNGYYPAYELYSDRLREGNLGGLAHGEATGQKRQLRLIVGRDRKVKRTLLSW